MASRIVGAAAPHLVFVVTPQGKRAVRSFPTFRQARLAILAQVRKGVRKAWIVKAGARPAPITAPTVHVLQFQTSPGKRVPVLVNQRALGQGPLPLRDLAFMEVVRLAYGVDSPALVLHANPAYQSAAARWAQPKSDDQVLQQSMEQHAVAEDLVGAFDEVRLPALRTRAKELGLKGYSKLSKTALFAAVGQAELAQADARRMDALADEADRILDAAPVATAGDFDDFP